MLVNILGFVFFLVNLIIVLTVALTGYAQFHQEIGRLYPFYFGGVVAVNSYLVWFFESKKVMRRIEKALKPKVKHTVDGYPKGTTHISCIKSQFGMPYKVTRLFNVIYFWCEYQEKWIESGQSKEALKLVIIR